MLISGKKRLVKVLGDRFLFGYLERVMGRTSMPGAGLRQLRKL